jgi:hypothetical protein
MDGINRCVLYWAEVWILTDVSNLEVHVDRIEWHEKFCSGVSYFSAVAQLWLLALNDKVCKCISEIERAIVTNDRRKWDSCLRRQFGYFQMSG